MDFTSVAHAMRCIAWVTKNRYLALTIEFMEIIRRITAQNSFLLSPNPFLHELKKEATVHNDKALASHEHDLTRLIAANPNTEISCGVEFRSPFTLQPLLGRHHWWPHLSKSISLGVRVTFTKISESKRMSDLEEAIERGNHKSAREILMNW